MTHGIRSIAVFCLLVCSACSTKKDLFLTARDGVNFVLPEEGISQQSLYPVPPSATEFSVDNFIRRPRPQPSFLGNPPSNYEQEQSRQRADSVQILLLGYNSLTESSLYIHPYQQKDESALQTALSQQGFIQQEKFTFVSAKRKQPYCRSLYLS